MKVILVCKEALDILGGQYKKGGRPELWDGRTGERIVEVLSRCQVTRIA